MRLRLRLRTCNFQTVGFVQRKYNTPRLSLVIVHSLRGAVGERGGEDGGSWLVVIKLSHCLDKALSYANDSP